MNCRWKTSAYQNAILEVYSSNSKKEQYNPYLVGNTVADIVRVEMDDKAPLSSPKRTDLSHTVVVLLRDLLSCHEGSSAADALEKTRSLETCVPPSVRVEILHFQGLGCISSKKFDGIGGSEGNMKVTSTDRVFEALSVMQQARAIVTDLPYLGEGLAPLETPIFLLDPSKVCIVVVTMSYCIA